MVDSEMVVISEVDMTEMSSQEEEVVAAEEAATTQEMEAVEEASEMVEEVGVEVEGEVAAVALTETEEVVGEAASTGEEAGVEVDSMTGVEVRFLNCNVVYGLLIFVDLCSNFTSHWKQNISLKISRII